jgi:flagellar M-ring protein FliF
VKERLAKIIASVRGTWETLPKAARIGVIVLGAGLLAVSFYLIISSSDGPMEPLYDTPVELADAAAIREMLKTRDIPHRINSDGSILVPVDQKLTLRMELASEGLQPVGDAGFELFDEQRFGASEFEQRVNFRRALEGELARTIRTLKAVETVRVHLNLPRRTLFRDEDTPPSASVVLKLKRGGRLTQKRVSGIQELVARGVERLDPQRVAVLDDQGQLLSQDQEDAGGAMALDYQRRYERQLERRVEEILERTIGEGHAVVRVAAQFDFSRMEETQEHYDPDRSVLRSEQLMRESEGANTEQPGGIPGVRSNLPGGADPQTKAGGASSARTSETRNYEVDKVVRRVLNPVARLKRQSVAVLIDGRWEDPTEEGGERTFTARDEQELARVLLLVKRSVGFDEERGDQVDVQSMPFVATETGDPALDATPQLLPSWATWLVAGAAALLVIAALFAVMRRKKKDDEKASTEQLPKTVKQMEAELDGAEAADALAPPSEAMSQGALPGAVSVEDGMDTVRQEALNLATQDYEGAARVIRMWLSEDAAQDDAQREEASP